MRLFVNLCGRIRPMNNMKSMRPFFFAIAFLLVSTGIVAARAVQIWSYQELLEKSDLVVIATPAGTNETKEHINLPGFVGQPAIGVETKFAVSTVLKGDKALKDFVFHHYHAGTNGIVVPNGPTFVSFDPLGKQSFILFLVKEADGRYAPVVGQVDPGFGIKELKGVGR